MMLKKPLIVLTFALVISCSSSTAPQGDSGSVKFFLQMTGRVPFVSQSVRVQMPSSANKFNLTATMNAENIKYSVLIVVNEEIEDGKNMQINGSNYIVLTITGSSPQNFRSDSGSIIFREFTEKVIKADFAAELFEIENPLNKTKITDGKIKYELE